MSDPTPFPNIKSKLHAPTKKSAFEKAKAEAEAKRLREEAETAAVYEDFLKSFSQDDAPAQSKPMGAPPGRGGFGGGPGGRGGNALRPPPPSGPGAGQRRHFTVPSTSGTGTGKVGGFSLGGRAERGAMEGPAGRKRNLEFDDHQASEREKRRLRDSNMGILAFENSTEAVSKKEDYFPQEASDEDEDDSARKEQPRPTVQLRNLPPGLTKDEVRTLFKETNPNMILDSIRLIPTVPLGPSSTMTAATTNPSSTPIRKAQSAIVTLSTETPSSEIDALTSTLQNHYLGLGFRLSISRQLASAALAITQPGFSGLGAPASRGTGNSTSNPFGAKALTPKPTNGGHQRAPPPGYHHPRGFAPPASFSAGGRPGNIQNNGNANLLQVHVTPPTSLRMLKLIHKTVESVFTHGPEFEALLMSQPSVRKDERWSFLFDTRSEEHAYYRWRLWEVLSGASYRDHGDLSKGVEIFEGPNQPLWVPPKRQLRYEWAGNLDDIVDDPDYHSVGEGSGSDSENEDSRRDRGMRDGPGGALPAGGLGLDNAGGKEQKSYLGPLNRGKLMWLVCRVPTSTTKVRRGDVARVMAFAIENASAAEEVVEVLVGNVIRPLGFQKHLFEEATPSGADDDRDNSGEEDSQAKKEEKAQAAEADISGAKIVALYLLSDVLSNSSLGIRNAWRYRGLVEQKLREAKVMESLGRTYRSPDWGRIRREKFRRLVVGILNLWEGWNVFPQGTMEEFMRGFMEGGREEREGSEKKEGGEKEEVAQQKTKSRWKTVDTTAEPAVNAEVLAKKEEEEMADGEEEEDVDGVPMAEDDEDVDGLPLEEDDDVDGAPMQADEEEVHKPPLQEENEPQKEEKKMGFGGMTFGVRAVGLGVGPPVKRKRPKAEDMFADDDDED
ncbi:hypothetical protein BGX38DRAFT_1185833 [Terfezia claveryi]|nr:hypothetical protein BGX38DRAFT_1185833 [Terfezia claveryi]